MTGAECSMEVVAKVLKKKVVLLVGYVCFREPYLMGASHRTLG